MKATLHIGVDLGANLTQTLRWLTNTGERSVLDGDGWNAWGEAVGESNNNDRTLHITVEVEADTTSGVIADAARIVTDLWIQNTLVQMDKHTDEGYPILGGAYAVLTNPEDWSRAAFIWSSDDPDATSILGESLDPRYIAD